MFIETEDFARVAIAKDTYLQTVFSSGSTFYFEVYNEKRVPRMFRKDKIEICNRIQFCYTFEGSNPYEFWKKEILKELISLQEGRKFKDSYLYKEYLLTLNHIKEREEKEKELEELENRLREGEIKQCQKFKN